MFLLFQKKKKAMLFSQGNRGLTAIVLTYLGQLPLAVVLLKTIQDTKILKIYLFYEKQHVGGKKRPKLVPLLRKWCNINYITTLIRH